MNNTYLSGLSPVGGAIVVPERAAWVADGLGNLGRGAPRVYRYGLQVGAYSRGWLGSFSDGLIALLLDAAHVALVLLGGYYLYRGVLG